jgi:hypothetical protein
LYTVEIAIEIAVIFFSSVVSYYNIYIVSITINNFLSL